MLVVFSVHLFGFRRKDFVISWSPIFILEAPTYIWVGSGFAGPATGHSAHAVSTLLVDSIQEFFAGAKAS